MMKSGLVAFLVVASTVHANPYFVGNPYSPVPPGCVVNAHARPIDWVTAHGNSALVWEGEVRLARADDPAALWRSSWWSAGADAHLRVHRVACAEPGRSALVAAITVPEGSTGTLARFIPPRFYRDYNGFGGPEFSLSAEPGDGSYLVNPGRDGHLFIGDYIYGVGYDGIEWFGWSYVLDVAKPEYEGFPPISGDDYNSSFNLGVYTPVDGTYIPIAATATMLERNASMPLNGRLSGIWVTDGASDQGLVLSFSNHVPPAGGAASSAEDTPLLLILTWFTFDADGQELWLTGAGEFVQGAATVTVPIERTAGGAFMDGARAASAYVGEVRLDGVSCDDLQMTWDLPTLSLGTGTRRLRRFEALEVAGYNCRDYDARQRSLIEEAAP